jgi:YidC/Oxa1 family membrane protein insertase
MNLPRKVLIVAIIVVGILVLQQWNSDYHKKAKPSIQHPLSAKSQIETTNSSLDMPVLTSEDTEQVLDSTYDSSSVVTVKTDVLDVKINMSGGDIIGLNLLKYPEFVDGTGNEPAFRLLSSPSIDSNMSFVAQSALAKTDGPKEDNQRAKYSSAKKTYIIEDGSDKLEVELQLKHSGISVVKKYIFNRSSYLIDLEYKIKNNSSAVWSDQLYVQLKRDNSKDPSAEESHAPVNTYLGGAVKTNDELYKKLPFDSFAKDPFRQKVNGGYAAIGQHYFVTAWVPKDQSKEYIYHTKKNKEDFNLIGFIDPVIIKLKPDQQASVAARLYAGPKDQDVLKKIASGLDLTVDYGMLWFIAQPLFAVLQWIHKFIGNWGWSIILLTIFVKALFYPLNATSFRSMAKMRKLTPKLQQLKEQYAEDKQKLSQAMMDLYKKEKVNPLGGCLPIIIQMPVFIALYWVLLESVELRQSSWMFWIKDLSLMDPYFILPLLMGASMFYQQTLNPPATDPMQAKVMKFMPLVFTFFFLWFPSGLVLYWITNNVISIVQQLVISKKIEKESN